ncbi:MAG: zinc ribbon domain-containing protein [Saprospiraceae bacterium]
MANNKELTVADKLKAIYELQLIDSKIDEIQILKGELPIEVSDLEDEIAGLETRIARLSSSVEDMEKEISRHDTNIKESTALIERYEKQMDNVKNNREYDALSKELELQRLEIQLSEKKGRESGVQLHNKKETLTAAEERIADKKKALEVKKEELEKIIAKTEKEEEKLKRKSEKQKKGVEDRLLKAYIKVRAAYRNGLSVVTISRSSCGGCFNKIPPQLQLEIAQRKKIVACEHCGRVLVDENIMTSLEELEAIENEAKANA